MTPSRTSNLNHHQNLSNLGQNVGKIELFIISRIGELNHLGWSSQRIAEALGLTTDFVEKALRFSEKSWK